MSCENFEEYIELNQNFEEKQLVRNGFLENIRRYRASLIEEGELENTKDWNELYFGFKVEKVTYMGKTALYRSHKRRNALFDFMFHKGAKNRYDSYIKFHVINAWTKFYIKDTDLSIGEIKSKIYDILQDSSSFSAEVQYDKDSKELFIHYRIPFVSEMKSWKSKLILLMKAYEFSENIQKIILRLDN